MRTILALLVLVAATPAVAQPIVVADSGDSAWVLASALIGLVGVLGGLALFYGRGRDGSTGFALLATSALGALIFAAFGYSLVFGEGSSVLGGASNLMLGNLADIVDGATISESVFALFEFALALFALGVLVASVANNARFGWLFPFGGLWFIVVYLPVARWVWAGWIGDLGAMDYAGGLAVHIPAGVAALVIALLLRGSPPTVAEDEPSLAAAGSALVAVGWLALIGGSSLGGGAEAASAIFNALIAASAAVVAGLVITGLRRRSFLIDEATLHLLAGLAAISAGAAFVGTAGAMILGIVAAVVTTSVSAFAASIKLGGGGTAFAIHGAPAIVGTLVFPVLMIPALGGADFAEGTSMASVIAAQGVAVLAVALWTAIATVIAAMMVSMIVPMRGANA